LLIVIIFRVSVKPQTDRYIVSHHISIVYLTYVCWSSLLHLTVFFLRANALRHLLVNVFILHISALNTGTEDPEG